MAFKTRRQRRYRVLREAGFLPFEAQSLSRVTFQTPYFDAMIRSRYRELKTALREDISQAEWRRIIHRRYRDNGWYEVGDPRKRSPFAMLRDFEEKYRGKNPNYKSPWEKRKKSWKQFVSTVEKDLAQRKTWEDRGDKYPPGYGKAK